ncbi:MAG: high-affinity nickel-transporter [Chloroflexota bacterium]
MKRYTRIGLVASMLLLLSLAIAPRSASAHPMGNFSINQYSALTVGGDKVELRYIIDMAEIPTFQELSKLSANRTTDLTPEQRASFIADKTAEVSKGLTLNVDGKPVQLTLVKSSLSFPLGNGGLPTLRLELHYSASLAGIAKGSLEYRDTNFLDRVGWKEIIAIPAEGTSFEQSSVPQTDLTNGLTQYSPSATSSPLNRTEAMISFAPGTAPIGTTQTGAEQTTPDGQGAVDWAKQRIDDVASLISQDNLSLGATLIGLLIAFVWGAGHALSPGHGKTVVAAYLVGTRGTARHAALLGLTVTVSHTIGVFALGLVVLFAANYIVPDQLYPIIGFASGFSIVVLGLVMFVQRWRSWRSARSATHDHDHDHAVAHEHGLEHSHSSDGGLDVTHEHDHSDTSIPHSHGPLSKPHTHLPADGQKITTGGLLALGITGGIIPCPTALVVLLAAVAYHRVALGLAWIFAFSLGLAAVLTGLGMLVVYGRSFVTRFRSGGGSVFGKLTTTLMPRLPMASALIVAVLGFLIAYQALQIR